MAELAKQEALQPSCAGVVVCREAGTWPCSGAEVGSRWELQRGSSQLGLSPLFFVRMNRLWDSAQKGTEVLFTLAVLDNNLPEWKWENMGFTIIPSFSRGHVNNMNCWSGRYENLKIWSLAGKQKPAQTFSTFSFLIISLYLRTLKANILQVSFEYQILKCIYIYYVFTIIFKSWLGSLEKIDTKWDKPVIKEKKKKGVGVTQYFFKWLQTYPSPNQFTLLVKKNCLSCRKLRFLL